MTTKVLILLRGLPGSGKSTLAKTLVGDKDYCHKEADMYFVDSDGNYKFEPSKIKEAHQWCKDENRPAFAEEAKRYPHPSILFSILNGNDIDPFIWKMVKPKWRKIFA